MSKPSIESIKSQVTVALAEDLGTDLPVTSDIENSDLTARLIPAESKASAILIAREDALLCGIDWFNQGFYLLDKNIVINWQVADGDRITADQQLCTIKGSARAILTAERTALNFLQTLSGVATLSAQFASATIGTSTTILDTRKTIPGLRLAQKYAVTVGGNNNHRIGLHDAILIKENHLASSESIGDALSRARKIAGNKLVEIEIESIDQLEAAIAGKADRIMLDNFSIEAISEAVRITKGRVELEVSGNVDANTVTQLIATGVDYISIGALTKHLRAVDFSMRLL